MGTRGAGWENDLRCPFLTHCVAWPVFVSHRRQLLEIIWPALSPGYDATAQRHLGHMAPSQTQLDMMERQGVATFDSQVGAVPS